MQVAQPFTLKHLFRTVSFAAVTTLILLSHSVGHANPDEGKNKNFAAVLSVGFPVNTKIDGGHGLGHPHRKLMPSFELVSKNVFANQNLRMGIEGIMYRTRDSAPSITTAMHARLKGYAVFLNMYLSTQNLIKQNSSEDKNKNLLTSIRNIIFDKDTFIGFGLGYAPNNKMDRVSYSQPHKTNPRGLSKATRGIAYQAILGRQWEVKDNLYIQTKAKYSMLSYFHDTGSKGRFHNILLTVGIKQWF